MDYLSRLKQPTLDLTAQFELLAQELEQVVAPLDGGSYLLGPDWTRVEAELAPLIEAFSDENGPLGGLDAPSLTESIKSSVSLGYMSLTDGTVAPWTSLLYPETAKPVSAQLLLDGGIDPDLDTREIQSQLRAKYPDMPRALSNVAAVETLKENASSGGSVLPGAAGVEVSRQGLGTPAQADFGKSVGDSLSQMKQDLEDLWKCISAKGAWEVKWYGVVLCLDRPCTDTLEKILAAIVTGGMGSVFGAIAAGTAASLFSGWIGIVIIAVMLGVAYWWAMIHFNKTPRGVCITHLWPIFMFPGWATGRK